MVGVVGGLVGFAKPVCDNSILKTTVRGNFGNDNHLLCMQTTKTSTWWRPLGLKTDASAGRGSSSNGHLRLDLKANQSP